MGLYTKIIDLQKLMQAWKRVYKNKPACGVDNVTCELFEANKKENIKQLQIELQEHKYHPFPVKRVVIYKGEKARTIALYSMCDKVVQQSIAQELNKMYEPFLSKAAYAYRSNKSALAALDEIEIQIKNYDYSYFLKLDIRHFFDTINWSILESILRKRIVEEDVIELIHENCQTKILEGDGEIKELSCGIHQGSMIAPVLSNIYLMEMDQHLEEMQDIFYVRYADDLLILGKSKEHLMTVLANVKVRLNHIGLEINEDKTRCAALSEGVDFLGYRFNDQGKTIPQKAIDNLTERLEILWLTSEASFEEKLKKAVAVIDGWEQYFRGDKEITSIFEFVAVITMAQNDEEYLKILSEKRKKIENIYKDITVYLGKIWSDHGFMKMELYEYEDFFQIPLSKMTEDDNYKLLCELLAYYRKIVIIEDEDNIVEIMQIYTDMRRYEQSAIWLERKNKLADRHEKSKTGICINKIQEIDGAFEYNRETAGKIIKVFSGREDVYSLENLSSNGKRQNEIQLMPLTEAVVYEHLQGNKTVGTYIQRTNSTVKSIIVDVDVSKKVLLQYDRSTDQFKEYLKKAFAKAKEIVKFYQRLGVEGYVEYSGCRGYHVWLLFSEWIPVRYANMFSDLIDRSIMHDDDITIEYFPNKTRIKAGKYGQCIKLPYGIHSRTGEIAYFINEDENAVYDINKFIDGIARYQVSVIKKILAANTDFKESKTRCEIQLEKEFLKNIPENVRTVLENCNLMKYLCQKVLKTGYLSHFERLSILYVFGHLGDEGKEFIHQLMGKTLNYQYNITEKFIQKIPQKPISCIKLRDQYRNVTAEYGCNCNFKRTKNCYPSPVLHAIALSNFNSESITVPTSRSLTKENEQKVIEELNVHKKAEEIARKILELKKQKRRLDASIIKIEKELNKLYENADTDCLEIEIGLLLRRKKDDETYEFIIEI